MRIVRFQDQTKKVHYGIVDGDNIAVATGDPIQEEA